MLMMCWYDGMRPVWMPKGVEMDCHLCLFVQRGLRGLFCLGRFGDAVLRNESFGGEESILQLTPHGDDLPYFTDASQLAPPPSMQLSCPTRFPCFGLRRSDGKKGSFSTIVCLSCEEVVTETCEKQKPTVEAVVKLLSLIETGRAKGDFWSDNVKISGEVSGGLSYSIWLA